MNGMNVKKMWQRGMGIFVLMSLLLSLPVGSWAQPQEPRTTSLGHRLAFAAPLGWGDEGIREVGVEWINDFPGTVNDRSHWDESCDGLYNRLLAKGWTGRFHWTDWNAYETDFKNESRGGYEDTYADTVDIAMLCTHGSGAWDDFWSQNLSSVYFGSTHADHDLIPGDVYHGYGDKDLEWLALDCCSVLSDGGPAPYYNRGYWAATMNGLHLMLGFKNTMYVWAPGDGNIWGFYMLGTSWPWGGWMLPPFNVTQSWFMAVDYVQPSVTCARVLAEVQDNYNDYLHGRGYVSSEPVSNGVYWYWDHCSTHARAQQIENVQQIQTMPVLQVQDRQVDEDYVWDYIVPSFGMTGTLGQDDDFFYLTDNSGGMTLTLLVDKTSGGFGFYNQSDLWVPPTVSPTLPSLEQALGYMDNWFGSQGEALPGAWYRTGPFQYSVEQLVEVQSPDMARGAGSEQVLSKVPTNVSINYERIIEAAVQTDSGPQQVDFPVVGPGGRLKVYMGEGYEILGMQGGSRDVQQTGGEVAVMTADQAWNMYLADPTVAIPEVPWVADVISKTSETLGYYEHPQMLPQSELIPVWIFTANYYQGGDLLAENVEVYVPAATEYLPPQVQIDSPAHGSVFLPGESIDFSGSVVQYGTPPFSYAWSASQDGALGEGASIVAALGTSLKGSSVFSQTVSLQVTDANGLQGSATTMVFIQVAAYLPLVFNHITP